MKRRFVKRPKSIKASYEGCDYQPNFRFKDNNELFLTKSDYDGARFVLHHSTNPKEVERAQEIIRQYKQQLAEWDNSGSIEASAVCANLDYGEEPYGFASRLFDQYNNEDWAYYISQELDYDADMYQELLADINNLRAGEWISDNMLNGLDSQALDAFKKFINYR